MTPVWSLNAGAPVAGSPAIAPDESLVVLLGGPSGGLLALDSQGKRRWLTPPCWTAGAPLLWPAVAAEGWIQVADCSVGADGSVRWRTPSSGSWTTPAALDADGNVYVGTRTTMSSYGPDGSLRWSYQAEGQVGPPSIGPYGVVAFSTRSPDRLVVLGR